MHVLDDAESVRAAAAIRMALALLTALEEHAPDVWVRGTISDDERAILERLAERLEGPA